MTDPLQFRIRCVLRNLQSMAARVGARSAREVNDLVNETIAKALPKLAAAPPDNLVAYLTSVMRSVVVDDARRDERRGRGVRIDARDLEPAAEPPPADDLVADLQRALLQLDDRDRALIRAIYFDELTQKEAAAELGLTRKELRTARRHALDRLKARLHR